MSPDTSTYASVEFYDPVLVSARNGVMVFRGYERCADVGYPCEYTLTPTHLLIRFGAVRQGIDYTEITAIEPSRSLWASPALSLQRVKIRYAGRFVLVSPKDRAHFIAALRQRVEVARSSVTA